MSGCNGYPRYGAYPWPCILTTRQTLKGDVVCQVVRQAEYITGSVAVIHLKKHPDRPRSRPWVLIHLPSGLSLAHVPTGDKATHLADEIDRLFTFEANNGRIVDALAKFKLKDQKKLTGRFAKQFYGLVAMYDGV
jgi:hypothetical protein